jgi:hypothetical protein
MLTLATQLVEVRIHSNTANVSGIKGAYCKMLIALEFVLFKFVLLHCFLLCCDTYLVCVDCVQFIMPSALRTCCLL